MSLGGRVTKLRNSSMPASFLHPVSGDKGHICCYRVSDIEELLAHFLPRRDVNERKSACPYCEFPGGQSTLLLTILSEHINYYRKILAIIFGWSPGISGGPGPA
jgi:hypothetical protein